MSITYNQLIARTPEWIYAQNRDIVAVMGDIIQQAHDQLINVMDHDLFRTVIKGKVMLAADGGVIDLSAESPRVLEVRAVRVQYRSDDGFTPLFRRDLETLTMLYARNRPRRPLYYAEYSGTLVLKAFPAPNSDYPIEITANVEPARLSVSNQTNIISTQFPRAMEKATFRQAALYMKNWEDAQMYEKEMVSAVTEANAQVQRRRRDETEKRPDDASNVQGV